MHQKNIFWIIFKMEQIRERRYSYYLKVAVQKYCKKYMPEVSTKTIKWQNAVAQFTGDIVEDRMPFKWKQEKLLSIEFTKTGMNFMLIVL